jgi:DNA polymerase
MEFECNRCELRKTCTKPVPGEFINRGKEKTIFFIGEAPGEEEDIQNRPFIGRSGKLLREVIKDLPYNIYITNVVKCRPPNNRKPNDDEINICKPYLLNEINIIKPNLIVFVGRTAESVKDYLNFQNTLFIYHPSYALRKGKAKEWINEVLTILKEKI